MTSFLKSLFGYPKTREQRAYDWGLSLGKKRVPWPLIRFGNSKKLYETKIKGRRLSADQIQVMIAEESKIADAGIAGWLDGYSGTPNENYPALSELPSRAIAAPNDESGWNRTYLAHQKKRRLGVIA